MSWMPGLEYSDRMYDRSAVFSNRVGAKGTGPLRLLVAMDTTLAGDLNGQTMFLHALNLIPRISRRYTAIDLIIPKGVSCRLPGGESSTLSQVALELLYRIQPQGGYETVSPRSVPYDGVISIGYPVQEGTRCAFIASDGWVASLGTDGPLPMGTFNPVGAQGAAALGVAWLFAQLEGLGPGSQTSEVSFNFYHMRSEGSGLSNPGLPQKAELGYVHIVGAGALTNAMLHVLRHVPNLRGTLIVSEPERLDLTNNNRYVLMRYLDGVRGEHKLWVVRRAFSHLPAVTVIPDPLPFGPGRPLASEFVVTAVDRVAPRLEVQQQQPRIVLNGGTDGQYFTVSRHGLDEIRYRRGACLGCTLQTDETSRRLREGTVSFVSSLAGISLSAMLLRDLVFSDGAPGVYVVCDALAMQWITDLSGLSANTPACPFSDELHSCAASADPA